MKLKSIVATLCLIIGISASAQSPNNNNQKNYPSEQLIKELNLSPKQIDAMKKLREETLKERNLLIQDMKNKSDKYRQQASESKAAVEKRKEAHRSELKTILSPEQYTKYLELRIDQNKRPKHKAQQGYPAKKQTKDSVRAKRRSTCPRECPNAKDCPNLKK